MSQVSSLHSIKIGIDFGTTYSGIAWTHTATPEEINIIDRWVDKRSRTSAKVPSEIAYTQSGVKWGVGIPQREPRLSWFKLLLDPAKYSLATVTNSPLSKTKQLIPRGKKPVDVVADYLSELYKHTITHLEKTLGKAVVEVSPLDFILTVPAVWSDAAKNLTLQAAERARFGRMKSIRLISEPEAAAVCCLKEIDPNHIKVGDTFVVADCGGGTVDLISYTVTRKSPKLEVVECVEGTGDLCGSTVLNEHFEKLVRNRIGNRFDKMRHEGRSYMMKEFNDSLKPNFTGSEEEELFTCPIPGVADDKTAGIEDGMFVIDRDEMKAIFDPVVQKIIHLVQQQVREVEKLEAIPSLPGAESLFLERLSLSNSSRKMRQVKALVLVGGFGESEYLRSQLEAEIRTSDAREIPILQPPNAWTAVVRGAVMRGLEGEIVRVRKVARNYGNSYSTPFITGFHSEVDSYIDEHDGMRMCENRMRWCVMKGEDAQMDNPIRAPYFMNLGSLDYPDCRIEIPLLANVYTVCTLKVDCRVIPREKYKMKIGVNGQPYFEINFHLLMSIDSAALVFQFEIDGTVYQDVRASYC